MVKIVLICSKDHKSMAYTQKEINSLSERLMPDNINAHSPLTITDEGILLGILNPNESLLVKNKSVCLGNLIRPNEDWWTPNTEVPEGSFALFRVNQQTIELVSDIVASRTIWYIFTENVFIASTSQRAIIFFLQNFEPNYKVIPWMLSSGTLGPNLSWDVRIKCLNGNSRLFLNRNSWDLKIEEIIVSFSPLDLSTKEFLKMLKKNIEIVFKNLQIDDSKWYLPLSGGYDSRAILLMLKDRYNLRCVTWGLKSSLNQRGNDAYVARKLANHFNIEHIFFETDISDEPPEKIFNRFLLAGEGRIDHIHPYMDGFKIWKFLFEKGVIGIIRGDEGFGWYPAIDSFHVRKTVGITLLSDYPNLKYLENFFTNKQTIPKNLQQKENESLASWRDRLYHEFRIPVMLAALNDLKYSYIELINPFLTKRIIKLVRKMPDNLRTEKNLFKKLISLQSPEIKFAKYPAIAGLKDFLKTRDIVKILIKELNNSYARNLLSDEIIDYIIENIRIIKKAPKPGKNYMRNNVYESLPKSVKKLLFKFVSGVKNDSNMLAKWIKKKILRLIFEEYVDFNILAFRAYLICKINKLLFEDAKSLNLNFTGIK